MGTIFALSWLITWFGHVLSDMRHVVRLYDFFLACHPLMPIYFAAVVGASFPLSVLNLLLAGSSGCPLDLVFWAWVNDKSLFPQPVRGELNCQVSAQSWGSPCGGSGEPVPIGPCRPC